jgi:putative ABC transport system ATP-binding protein
MLKLAAVSKYYKIAGIKRCILNKLNFKIEKGRMIAVTGKSGSGKTTLLNVISGITAPSSGNVFFQGKRVSYFLDIHSSWIRNKKLGFIFQTFRLIPDETVLSNVLMPARILGKLDRQTVKKAESLLKEMEIHEYRNTKAGLLSGGQKQRVAIARALINNPELILADEPTANLDKKTALEICRILEKIVKQGQSVLVVTHQEYLIKRSHEKYQLKDGKLEALD